MREEIAICDFIVVSQGTIGRIRVVAKVAYLKPLVFKPLERMIVSGLFLHPDWPSKSRRV